MQRTAVICEPLRCYRAEQPELLQERYPRLTSQGQLSTGGSEFAVKLLRHSGCRYADGHPASVVRRLGRGFGDQVLKKRYQDYRRPLYDAAFNSLARLSMRFDAINR